MSRRGSPYTSWIINIGVTSRCSTYQKVKEVSEASVDDHCLVIGPLDHHLVDLVRGGEGGRGNGHRP